MCRFSLPPGYTRTLPISKPKLGALPATKSFDTFDFTAIPGLNKVFPDPAMTIASIDRLVHHSTIIEMNVESDRQRAATTRKRRQDRKNMTASDTMTTPDADCWVQWAAASRSRWAR